MAKPQRPTWTADECQAFLTRASSDRLYAALRLAIFGMRRGEILGLRWSDVELSGTPSITIRRARVLVDYVVVEKSPKSVRSARKLPLDAATARALQALRDRQVLEEMEAGTAYSDSGYVVVNEIGAPLHPEQMSDLFAKVAKLAGVPVIRLHDGRHTGLSLMEKAGVPISVISAWAGHFDVGFTYSNYVHAGAADLSTAADALGSLYQVGEVTSA